MQRTLINQTLANPIHREYSAEELAEALNVLTRVGVFMLESGAASFRTKDTMERFAAALGIAQFDTFVTPTKIIGIVTNSQGSFTRALRVPSLGVDMARISLIHHFAHHPQNVSPAQLGLWLDGVGAAKPDYAPAVILAGVAAACACFAIILGGGPVEAAAAALGAGGAQAVRLRLRARHVNPYLLTAISAMVASLVAYLVMLVLGASQPRIGLIASVLLLVPGAPLITALLDLLHLDLISGVTRGVYAAILIFNIGVGMLLVLAFTGFSVL
jgi:uncharacterized membrane protein YjjP (DUF1212 family)